MTLTIRQETPGCADGSYHIKAPGSIAASLYWATQAGALPHWQPFAFFPIAPNGTGCFTYTGGRAIPKEATHVLARTVSADFAHTEDILVPIPLPGQQVPAQPVQRFLLMTDLHLSSKPWQIRKALTMAKGYDAVLITGDMTNDGTQAQLERFWSIVRELVPRIPVFTVAGNHDYPKEPLPCLSHGICAYPCLQHALLDQIEAMGIAVYRDASGAYAARMGDTAIIGLNAVTHWRRFQFPDNAQLDFLAQYLHSSTAAQHLVLCHAPLAGHCPHKEKGETPYLSRDKQLQQILDESGKPFLFLSGHTHISLNCSRGCADRDGNGNIYINAGSIRPTALKSDEAMQPECWTEGNVVELLIGNGQTAVTGISTKTGQRIARGHYVFVN